jgi:hypothetical protein
MTVSDEALMAYADGEADASTRADIETAMRNDPELRRRVEQHRALRQSLQGAFAAALDEPVPQRLIDAARGHTVAPGGKVVDLASARAVPAAVAAPAVAAAPALAPGRGRWQSFAMAASLLVGVGVGYLGWHDSDVPLKAGPNGELVAASGLAEALSNQLSEERSPALVATTGLSFRAKTGDYCRTFLLTGSGATSGLACREGDRWKIKALAQAPSPAADPSNFRQAASADSPAVRAAVEESIDGEPLDRAGEIAARGRKWAATPAH